ncbi:MAG: PilZ domain-containing protein [Deltaproteobacteria bacterium]|nr:PilZ domain-containing protein [Deltaproteobacteria bacterium]
MTVSDANFASEEGYERKDIRRDVHVHCLYASENSHTEGKVVDLSREGAGMECLTPFEIGAVGELHVDSLKLKAPGIVRWCLPHKNLYRVGIEFLQEETY